MNTKPAAHEPEFSCLLPVEKIPAAGVIKVLEANGDERRRLAARFGLPELPKLWAELTVQSAHIGQAISVKGRMVADVVQRCVVTSELLPGHIEQNIDVLYTTSEPEKDTNTSPESVMAEIESITNGAIDLGELVAQTLGIALDPYPRKPGMVFQETACSEDAIPASPLMKLAEWRRKSKE